MIQLFIKALMRIFRLNASEPDIIANGAEKIGAGLPLITGNNGTGKSNFLISELYRMQAALVQANKDPAIFFVHAIPDLLLDHTVLYCRNSGCKWCGYTREKQLAQGIDESTFSYVDEWFNLRQKFNIHEDIIFYVIIDEAALAFPSRSTGSKVPEYVSRLQTRRSDKIYMYLLCPEPVFLDFGIKKLVQPHIHFDLWFYDWRRRFEYGSIQDNPSKLSKLAIGSFCRLRQDAFGLYTSESGSGKSGKVRRKVPLIVFVFLGFAGYALYNVVLMIVGFADFYTDDPLKKAESSASVSTSLTESKPVAVSPLATVGFIPSVKLSESKIYRVVWVNQVNKVDEIFVLATDGVHQSFTIDASFCTKQRGQYQCELDGELITVSSGEKPKKSAYYRVSGWSGSSKDFKVHISATDEKHKPFRLPNTQCNFKGDGYRSIECEHEGELITFDSGSSSYNKVEVKQETATAKVVAKNG